MNQEKSIGDRAVREPLYVKIWHRWQSFPQILAKGSERPPASSGTAAAALISAGIGSVLMMAAHHLADTSAEAEALILQLGSWIPGCENNSLLWGSIGSFAGKETALLIGWLGSWLVLHHLWHRQQIKAQTMFWGMFALFAAATMMIVPPLFPYLPLMPN